MPDQNQRLDELKQKYASVLNAIQQNGVRLSHVHVQDNKLFLQGEAPSQEVKNKIWDQIKLVDATFADLTADISVSAPGVSDAVGSAAGGGMQSYTVQPGDSLSKISMEVYGSAAHYMKIFEANKDQLSDPDKIRTGQVLKIPQK